MSTSAISSSSTVGRQPVVGADRRRRARRRRRPGTRPAARPAAARRGQQVPAPLDHRPQRPVPGQCRRGCPGSSRNRSASRRGDLGQRQHPQPGRGQLDGQRQPVQPADDLDHAGDVVVVEQRSPGGRARARSSTAGPPGSRPRSCERQRPRAAGQRREGAQRLAGDAQRLPAGGEHPHPRARGQDPVDELGRRPIRCSQLSITSRQSESRERVEQPVHASCGGRSARSSIRASRRPRAPRTAAAMLDSSVTGASSISQAASRCPPASVRRPRWPAGSCPPRPDRPPWSAGRPSWSTRSTSAVAADEAGQPGRRLLRPPAPAGPGSSRGRRRRAAAPGAGPGARELGVVPARAARMAPGLFQTGPALRRCGRWQPESASAGRPAAHRGGELATRSVAR